LSAAKPVKAPITRVAKGAVLHRVHGETRAARWYGRRDATSRWDDPDGDYGVLYLGRSPVGAFAETLLRTPADRDVLWSRAEQRRQAAFKTLEPLQLATLHGAGLAWFEVTAAQIAESDYTTPQGLSRRIHAIFPVDGIQYRSRFDNDELCVALFDRADPKLELVTEGDPIDKAWARQTLARRGYRLIDL
jgi:RES domain